MLGEVAVDGGLEVDQRAEDAAAQAARVMAEKKVSTAFSQEPEVGVWWKVQRSCRSSQARTLGCLWVLSRSVSRMQWTSLPAGTAASTALRKRMNSWCRCRCMQRPNTVPSRIFSAANKVVVPWRT